MIVVTGATGKLGHHVIEALLRTTAADQIVAAVRTPEKAGNLSARGVQVREADYSKPETLASAFAGATKVLLISSSEVGQRLPQHQAVVDAARAAGVQLLAYTSILRADTSTLALAAEHKATEEYIRASGLPFVFLRNGWYIENRTETLNPALEHGVLFGAAQEGQFASASRTDYAEAAAAILAGSGHENRIYELAGDTSYTLSELAARVSLQASKTVTYHNLAEQEYTKMLEGFGLPTPLAELIADADAGASRGELNSSSHDLSTLIGHPTLSLEAAVKSALQS